MLNVVQNTDNGNVRRRLDFSNEEKPKRQTTNVHMFLNLHQNKPKSMQSDPSLLNKSTPQIPSESLSPKKDTQQPTEHTTTDSSTEQKYAGGGYSKSPNPKSLGKPSLTSPLKSNVHKKIGEDSTSDVHNKCTLPHSVSVPLLGLSPNGSTAQGNVVRFDSESFFRIVNSQQQRNPFFTQSNVK